MSDQKTEQKPDHEKRIREALEAGPAEGPFEVVRDGSYSYDIKTTDGYIVATTHGYVGEQVNSRPTANFMAACDPLAIRALLADLDAVRADAQRYLYLRDVAWGNGSLVYFDHRYDKDEWDAKIDAAIKGASA